MRYFTVHVNTWYLVYTSLTFPFCEHVSGNEEENGSTVLCQ